MSSGGCVEGPRENEYVKGQEIFICIPAFWCVKSNVMWCESIALYCYERSKTLQGTYNYDFCIVERCLSV